MVDIQKIVETFEGYRGDGKSIYLGCGVSRNVYKLKHSRFVLKCESNKRDHGVTENISEYTFYRGLEGHPLQSLFAKCIAVSKDGIVMAQEYLPKSVDTLVPINYNDEVYLKDIQDLFCKKLKAFLEKVTKDKNPIFDLHTSNIRMTRHNEVKITDYSTYLCPLTESNKFKIETVISRMKKYNYLLPTKAEFYRLAGNNLKLKLDGVSAISKLSARQDPFCFV